MLTEPPIQASRGWASKAIKTQSWCQNQFNKPASWKLVLDEIQIIFFCYFRKIQEDFEAKSLSVDKSSKFPTVANKAK